MNMSNNDFKQLVTAIFSHWSGLQIAVREGFGGAYSSDKAVWLVDVIVDYFRQFKDVDEFDLEDYVSEILYNEFDWVIDPQNDGSDLTSVCKEVCHCYNQCQQGKSAELMAKYASLPQVSAAVTCQRVSGSDDSSDSEDDSADQGTPNGQQTLPPQHSVVTTPPEAEQNGPTPMDEDGWTTVVNHKRKT